MRTGPGSIDGLAVRRIATFHDPRASRRVASPPDADRATASDVSGLRIAPQHVPAFRDALVRLARHAASSGG